MDLSTWSSFEVLVYSFITGALALTCILYFINLCNKHQKLEEIFITIMIVMIFCAISVMIGILTLRAI